MITFKETLPLKDYDSVSLAEVLRAHFIEKYPVAATQRLGDAIQVASYLHRNDVRRGARGDAMTPPYIEHPLRVSVRMANYFGVTDPDILLAGVLHDTVEDHAPEFADFEGHTKYGDTGPFVYSDALGFLSKKFGYSVTSIVALVSNPTVDYATKAEKIEAYQEHVTSVIRFSPEALIVKISDFVDNAGSLHHHYEYGDKKVQYFLDRYEPMIPAYLDAVAKHSSSQVFDAPKVVDRVNAVASQFNMFRPA
jgi:(p)ppGpp synthase/HD superfamily hydrolase